MIGDENLLLYVNLTGELFYIIIHRMNSQGIRTDLQKRVYDDLSLVICNPQVLQDLQAGNLKLINYSFTELRMMLCSIVHSSIMNINDYSMEKLFELTLIATKYQYSVCQNPKHILLIALNHVDSIRKQLTDPLSIQSAENLHYRLIESYSWQLLDMNPQNSCDPALDPEPGQAQSQSPGQVDMMKTYQAAILACLKDVRLKMTNLIKLGLQRPNGEFVLDPVSKFYKDAVITPAVLELNGDRRIKLGLSVYEMEIEPSKQTRRQSSALASNSAASEQHAQAHDQDIAQLNFESDANQILKAIQGLDLCGTLLGCKLEPAESMSTRIAGLVKAKDDSGKVGLGFGPTPDPNSSTTTTTAMTDDFNVVRIDARCVTTNGNSAIMSQIVRELDMPEAEALDQDRPKSSATATAHLLELAMDNHSGQDPDA